MWAEEHMCHVASFFIPYAIDEGYTIDGIYARGGIQENDTGYVEFWGRYQSVYELFEAFKSEQETCKSFYLNFGHIRIDLKDENNKSGFIIIYEDHVVFSECLRSIYERLISKVYYRFV